MPVNDAFQKLVRSKTRFRMFLLTRLPSAYFAGLQLRACTDTECVVEVPFRWFTKNPFRSTYFACLAMGAELSTGALCMQYIYGRKPAVSMLVTAMEAQFFKKATGITQFTCADGAAIAAAIDEAMATGEGQIFTARSTGRNEQGELVAAFSFTWSFKARVG
ncbi:DUF4442 domain-containing protein [Flaviaesturariibacter aridisoli]|uniref:DUF4442 domain-containing protein n=1 Tax=Flaviaesturariibacter aridisoli TaxID=2545761 RepID=A0A4R4DYR6_9BACT|nr:DUF4442 domain-containing protein [Flaviaesturariibacter aridisoli]TCZ68595.1 DUF4442 domain-containing protein [Flaviaesturariibacter aridisoli]